MCVLNIQSTSFKKGESRQIRDIVRMLGMNIAGVGLEQDVAMENVDMKTGPETGAAGMAGFAASPHLLYFVILFVFRAVCGSIFGWLQAVGRYVRRPQGRRVRRAPVLLLPTLCLALAFVFFSAFGALAQPDGSFDVGWRKDHDGKTPFSMTIVFTSEGTGFKADSFTASDITFAVPTDCMNCLPPGGNFERDYKPTVSEPMPDLQSETKFTFTVTPRALNGESVDFSVTIAARSVVDLLDQLNESPINTDSAGETIVIRYMKETLPALTAAAGLDKSVVSEGTVTLDGSGTATSSGREVTYLWTQTSGTGGMLTSEKTLTPSFKAPELNSGDAPVIHEFTLTVSDDVVGSTAATDTVMVTVFPALTAEAGPNKSVVSEGTVTLDGSGTATSSGREVTYLWTQTSGTGGMLTSETTLTPSFKAPALNPGDAPVIHEFTLTVSDDDDVVGSTAATDTVMVTVFPALTAEAGPNKSVVSEGTVTLDGSGTATSSGREVTYLWTQTSGTGGMLTSEKTLTPSFKAPALNPGDAPVIHEFTLTVSDDDDVVGSTAATDTVMVTVFPALTAEAGPNKSVVSEGTVTLDGSGTATSSGREVTYLWTQTSGTGGMLTSETTLTPSFKAPELNSGDAPVIHEFTLTVSDDDDVVGSTAATDTVMVTVFPALTAEAGPNKSVVSEGTVTLDGSGTATSSGREVTYLWTQTSGTGGMLTSETTLTPSFKAPALNSGDAPVIHEFTLTVSDDDDVVGSTAATDTVMVTVFPALTAAAGLDKSVVSEGTVTLDGSGTATSSGREVTYLWTQTSGTGGMLTSETTLTPSFKAPELNSGDAPVIHEFTLTVSDDDDVVGSTATTDTVMVTVFPALTAAAGLDKSVVSEGTVTLDGSGTATSSGREVTYLWTQTSGTGGMLTSETTLTPSFKAPALNPGDAPVIHEFTLTVSDDDDVVGSTAATDTVMVTVTAPLPALTAAAGLDKSVVSEGTVTLDGSGTATSSGREVTYLWTQTSGTGGMLTSETTLTPSFKAPALNSGDAPVIHEFTLTVSDDDDVVGSTAATDTVMVTVFPALTAAAGLDKSVVSEGTVTLDGSGTATSSGREVTYLWTQTSGTGGMLTSETTLTPSFKAPELNSGDAPVIHEFTLTVSDDDDVVGSTAATDTVMVTVFPALTAAAGLDKSVVSEGTVTLDGSGTATSSGREVTYLWTQTSGTGGMLTSETTLTPSFKAPALNPGDAPVIHEFTLTVSDDDDVVGSTAATDTVMVTVTAPLPALTAAAGLDKSVVSEGTVTLDGSGTATGGGREVTYLWTQTSGTGGMLTSETTLTPSFKAPALNPGDAPVIHEFTLTVSDDVVGSTAATDTVMVTVFPALTAEAGPNKSVVSEGTVTLDGSGTATSSGREVTYLWTQTSGTGGMLTSETTLTPSFKAPALNPGDPDATHTFTLTVSDDQSSMPATSTVTVTVTALSVDIVLDPPEVSVQEGGSGTYRIRLSESPGRAVTIMATSGNEAVVRLKNTRLVFNAGNWNDWQEVEIDAVADSVKKGDGIKVIIEHSLDGVASKKPAVVTVSVRAQEDDPILDHVGQFIATRATTLLGQQPDLIHFLKQDGLTQDSGGSFTFQATDGRLSLDGGFIHDGTWGEVTGARTNSKSTDTKSVLGSFGIHRKYSETFLTGLMLQFDRADHELPQQTGTIDGTGWLVGPYFVARHGSQPLYFEGRLLYGYSDNDIRFMDRHLGARTGSFDSTRVLAQIRVEGEIAVPGWDHGDDGGAEVPQLIPYADLRWLEDRAAAFTTVSATTGFRVPVPGQTVNISQLELGSNMVVPVAVPTGSMILTGGLGLVFSNTEGNHIKSVARGRGRGEIGFSYGLDENVQIDFESFYDGIGSSGYEGYGLSLNAEMRF